MFIFSKFKAEGLLLACFVFLAGYAATAQTNPGYLINQQEINLKSGLALSELQQQETIMFSIKESASQAVYDKMVLYLARGNRPLAQQTLYFNKGTGMEISEILKIAMAGDRLVLELIPEKQGESTLTVVALY